MASLPHGVPGHCFPSGFLVAILSRWAKPGCCPACFVWRGSPQAFPNCQRGLSSALLLELMFGVYFLRIDTEGRVVSYLDWGCLDTLPLVVILLSLCWAPARQLVWLLGSSWLSKDLYFDKKDGQAKVVFLPLCRPRKRLLSLTGVSCENTKGRLPCP